MDADTTLSTEAVGSTGVAGPSGGVIAAKFTHFFFN
jgi:hypothetical protein